MRLLTTFVLLVGVAGCGAADGGDTPAGLAGDTTLPGAGGSGGGSGGDPRTGVGGGGTSAVVDAGGLGGAVRLDAAAPDAPQPSGVSAAIPIATGTCPDFVSGSVTFSPAGIAPRAVKLWVGAGGGGPIVFYWHGTGSSPDEAAYGLGPAAIAAITASGGVVAAPTHDANAGQWPWYLVSGTQLDDLLLADEVLACAVEKKQIDTLRIHVAGMSAGGLMTAQMSLRRSSYVASAAPYSGGIIAGLNPPNENPANKLSALIFWGGTSDVVVISFQDASMAYSDLLRHNGSSTILCNHGGGHTIPQTGVPAVWRFFQDHPFGTSPSPYVAAGLPSVFPSYCTL